MKSLYSTLLLLLFVTSVHASNKPWVTVEYPQDQKKTWWSDSWWEDGRIETPANYGVTMEEIEFTNGETTVPAYVYRPTEPGNYPAVLFQHGRRGLDDLTLRHPKRLAARGFIVLAPDVYAAHFIEKFPMEHDYIIESDVAAAIDVLLQQKGVKGGKACVVSHTRGGYFALKALVNYKKQEKEAACYVSYYPHWQDPNAVEPMQIYRYANEVNDLKVPVLVFLGEHDQYQRIRPIVMGIEALQEKGRDAQLIVYPGVGRGFDFRPPHVRTFADDLAAKDAMQRAARFIRKHLEK
jgi:carboxymethylenebutenolidase